MATTTYKAMIAAAKDLLSEQLRDPVGEANPEYERGIVELIALTCHGTAEATALTRMDIGLKDKLMWSDEIIRGDD